MTSIQTNVGALAAQNGMTDSLAQMNEAMNRLTTGLRINSAADDAAGSAIASKMDAQTRSLGMAVRNANDAISMTQTAEGALGEIENILQRMRELSVQAGNSSLNASDRAQIQSEVDQLTAEIDSIATQTNFNQNTLLDGTKSSLQFQVGIDGSDTLNVALKTATVDGLGIGTSTSAAALTSERVTAIAADIAAADIKINGEDFSAAALDVDSTSFNSGDGRVDATGFGDADNSGNGGKVAATLAAAINSNSHVHGASASAFNKVVGNGTFALTGTIDINDVTLATDSSTTLSEFIDLVNGSVAGVLAEVDSANRIVLSNTDGDEIVVANGSGEIGIADDIYGGFVQISNLDGSAVKIEAGSDENGFGSSAAGIVADVNSIGFNEINGSTVTSGQVTSTALASTHNVKINGVALGSSSSASAADKAAAINAVSDQTGVTASAKTVVRLTVDLSVDMSTHTTATVQGITVNMNTANGGSAVDSMATMVSAINTAMGVNNDITATSNADGELVLTSESGQTIAVAGGTGTGLFTDAVVENGADPTSDISSSDVTVYGTLTLTSADGAPITIEDGEVDTHTGLATLGLQAQSEKAETSVSGVSVSSVANANAALTSIDAAITSVSEFRASFGAYENRLDSIVSNLTTYKTNLEASKGRIVDADFATETSKLTKAQILQQAATSMLAQANASKQGLLALLQG